MVSPDSILTPQWCDRPEGTFLSPRRAHILRRITVGGGKDFRFIFGYSTIGADPPILRGRNGDDGSEP